MIKKEDFLELKEFCIEYSNCLIEEMDVLNECEGSEDNPVDKDYMTGFGKSCISELSSQINGYIDWILNGKKDD